MDLEKLRLTIEAQTAQAEKGIETINDLLKKQRNVLEETKQETARNADDAVRSFSKWSSAYYRALGLVNQFGAAVKMAYGAAAEGAQIQAAESFFKNAGKSISDLRQATGGMISDAELMKKANLADSMGISMDTFKSLAKVAQASALKTGQSFDHMFESIVVGTARSSRLLLDNLGIIISVDEANKNYARTQLELAGNHKATNKEIKDYVDRMDDVAKKAAFAEEVQRKATGTLGEYAGAAVDAAEKFGRFEASVSNFQDTLKKSLIGPFSELASALTTVIDRLNDVVKALNAVPQGKLAALGSVAAVLAGAVGGIAAGSPLGIPGMAVGAVGGAVAGAAGALGAFGGKAAEERAGQIEMLNTMEQQVRDLFIDPQEVVGKSAQQISDDFNFLDAESVALLQSFASLNKMLGTAILPKAKEAPKGGLEAPKPPKEGRGKSEKDYRYDLWVAFLKEEEDQLKATQEASKNRIAAFNKEMAAMAEDALKLREKIAESTMELGGKGVALPSKSKALTVLDTKLSDAGIDAADRLEKMAEAARQADLSFREWAKSAAGDVTTGLATGTGAFGPLLSSFASMAGDAISGLLSSVLGAAGGGAVGAIVGALLPVIGSLIDELKPVADLLTGVAAGLASFVKFGLGELLAGLGDLAKPVKYLLTSLGLVVGALIRPLAYLLTPLIQATAYVMQGLAALLVYMLPLADLVGFILNAFGTLGIALITMFLPMEDILQNFSTQLSVIIGRLLQGAIDFNNTVVTIARDVFGMKGFGKFLKYEDFLGESIDENKDAVEENTRALRDLAREFRNMPAGYKVARTVYDAADASMQPQQSVVMTMSETAASAVSRRWRT